MKTQREEILKIIRESDRHMNADEIYLTCRKNGINISMATVYRNLGIMAEDHTLQRVPVPGKPDCFDKTTIEHSHKVCKVCGEISDADVGNLKEELEKRSGSEIIGYDLCLHYICQRCKMNKHGR